MDKEGFIKYADVVKLLEDNDYYGLTVKRIGKHGTRLKYKFVSIKWYTIDIEVETLRLDGDKIIVGITFDGEEINGFNAFKDKFNGIRKMHSEKRKTTGR